MPRGKRTLDEEVRPFTIKMRASVYDKLQFIMGPSGSKVATIEDMTEYIFNRKAKRKAKLSNTINDSSLKP